MLTGKIHLVNHPSTARHTRTRLLASVVAATALTLTGCANAAATPAAPTAEAPAVTVGSPAATETGAAHTAPTREGTAPRRSGDTYRGSTHKLLRKLAVAAESGTAYDRDLYDHWNDEDRDGCDTREEVGIAEATTAPTIGSGCSFSGGAWKSYYDGVTTTDYSTFDVDHLVPLGEAHPSGAWAWDAATKEAYANDLNDKRALVAVTASSNRSKSDRDPVEWLPAKGQCRYLGEWVAIKWRWNLTIDPAEKTALKDLAATCDPKRIKVARATITTDPDAPDEPDTPTDPAEPVTPSEPGMVTITGITYDPLAANTSDDPWDEVVTIHNQTTAGLDISGWTITDKAGATYTFPSAFTLPADSTVTFHNGTGTNTATDLYANRSLAVWNNTGDTATLTDASGAVVDVCTYTGNSTGATTC